MIPLFKVYMSDESVRRASEVLKSGYIGQGPVVEEFESQLREWLQTPRVLTTNTGTSAHHLALHLLKRPDESVGWHGMNAGDVVLTTPATCTATTFPILANGFRVQWIDIDPETLNVDLDDLESKLTDETKLIVVLHWGGNPVDLHRLAEICVRAEKKFGFCPWVIEDCAHAFGAYFDGLPIGSYGNLCFFSFQAVKSLNSVDGGCLTVPTDELYRRGKLIRWYGLDRKSYRRGMMCEQDVEEWGFKFHMNDVNAAVGLGNLAEISAVIHRQQNNHDYYMHELAGVDGLQLLKVHPLAEPSVWLFTVLVERRQAFADRMTECGIMVSPVHRRNDEHPCVAEFRSPLPKLDSIANKVIAIPCGWWVTDEQREYIVDCVKKGW